MGGGNRITIELHEPKASELRDPIPTGRIGEQITMLSKTLLKLIDEAILPAVIVVAGKILGIALLNPKFGLPFTLNLGTLSEGNINLVNAYSNLFSYGGVIIGLSFILIRSFFFHDTHISPQVTIRLYRFNLTSIIETTYELFHQAIVWLSYLWLLTILFILQAYWGLTPWNISLGTLAVTVVFSCLFAIDVDREIDTAGT